MRQGIRLPFLTAVLCLRVEFPQILLFGLKIRTVWARVPLPLLEVDIATETIRGGKRAAPRPSL
jgi:hypothetical protein